MALVGDNTAFVPIGLSWQVAWQLEQNRAFLALLLGEPLDHRPSFFDRTITSADAAAAVIRHMAASPITERSIEVPSVPFSAPILTGHKLWLWLETTSHQMTDAALAEIVGRYETMRQEFLALASMPRRIFVIASGQNDILTNYPYLTGAMRVDFDAALIADLRQTLDTLFPDGENHLLVIGKAPAVAPVEGAQALPEEHTIWHGLTPDWRHALFAFLQARLPELAPDAAAVDDRLAVITALMTEGQRLRLTQTPGRLEDAASAEPEAPAARMDELHRRLTRASRERDALAHRTALLERRYALAEALWRTVRLESLRHRLRRLLGRPPRH